MPWGLIANHLEKYLEGRWWLKPLFGGALVSLVVGFAFGTKIGWATLFREEFIKWINFSFLLGVFITGFGMSLSAFRAPATKTAAKVWISFGIALQAALLLALGVWAVSEIIKIESTLSTEQAQALNP